MQDNLYRENLVIISNERASQDSKFSFSCINADLQILPEGLTKYFDVFCIFRRSKLTGNHKIIKAKVSVASNLFKFIINVFKTLKIKNTTYLLVTITPYSFIAFLILFFFRKKIFVYLMSSGHEEWKYILGPWSVWIFDIMFKIVTNNSKVIVCNKRLYDEKKSFLVSPARLDKNWFDNHKEPKLDIPRYVYVGRFNPEKGIENFIKLFSKIKQECKLSIVGEKKKLIHKKNIELIGYVNDEKALMSQYDNNNITILPSFTEAHPYVIDESLSRNRPVIIFEDIEYVKGNREGVFVIRRNLEDLIKVSDYILKNYIKVQNDIKKNILPSKESMIEEFNNIFSLS